MLCVIYSWNHFPEPHNPKAFLALILLLETGMNGTFVAQDLILFFIFFELVLLPMFFMIGVWGGPEQGVRVDQVLPVHDVRLGADAAELPCALLQGRRQRRHPRRDASHLRHPDARAAHGAGLVHGTQLLIFGGLFLGFAIKVPMFPFHTWLPDAHTEAPTVGSVLLAAILLKLGTYGFIRIALPILPDAARSWAPWIGLLAVIGIIYGALNCLAQKDMKRLIAFSSIAHMGFVMLGIATLTSFGINAAVFGMVAHGLITGMLFFIAGSVQHNFHTREMSRLGGLLLAGAEDGLDPRLLRDGLARPARSRRLLGRVPGDPLGVPTRGAAQRGGVPHASWSSPRSAPCSPPAICSTCCSRSRSARSARSSPTRTSTTSASPSGSRGRRCCCCILVLGIFPNLIFKVTDVAVHPMTVGDREGDRAVTHVNPAIDWHALAPDVVLVGDDRRHPARRPARCRTARAWQTSRIAALGVLGALDPGAHARRRRPRTGRCSAARTSSTTTRSR